MLKTKIYPNGEITFSWERRKRLEPLVKECIQTEEQRVTAATIKNHGIQAALDYFATRAETQDDAHNGLVKSGLFMQRRGKALRRGGKGITRYSRRIIECGAALIEDSYDKSLCSFLTLTLPPSDKDWTIQSVNLAYNRFQTALLRELRRHKLPGLIIGCVEAHPKRSEREGRMVPHFHLLFVGRERYKNWAIGIDWFAETWVRCLINAGVVCSGTRRDAAISVEMVKKSVTSYMGKYLSKAIKFSNGTHDETAENECPGSWHKISRELLTKIKKEIKIRKGGQAESLLDVLRNSGSEKVSFTTALYLDWEGEKLWIGEYFRVNRLLIPYFLQASMAASLVE